MREVRLLCSTGITPLPHYYEPVRLPAAADVKLWIPPRRCGPQGPHLAGSPRTLYGSVGTRPPHSPRAARCVHLLITTASVAGFSTFGRLATAIGLTRPNRVRNRWARAFALVACGDSPGGSRRRTNPSHAISYPPTPDWSYMLNEQFAWLTPRSQQEHYGLPWRNRSTEDERRRTEAWRNHQHSVCHRIGVGTRDWFRAPLPPNRTGGFPASGSPVEESPPRGLMRRRMGIS